MFCKNLFYKNLNIIYKKVILDTFKCRKVLFRMVIHKHFLTLCNIRFFSSYQLVIIRWFWEQNGPVINISPFFYILKRIVLTIQILDMTITFYLPLKEY